MVQQELMEIKDPVEMVAEVLVVVILHKLQLQLQLQILVVEAEEVLETLLKKVVLVEKVWLLLACQTQIIVAQQQGVQQLLQEFLEKQF